jgi:hypothetical protein
MRSPRLLGLATLVWISACSSSSGNGSGPSSLDGGDDAGLDAAMGSPEGGGTADGAATGADANVGSADAGGHDAGKSNPDGGTGSHDAATASEAGGCTGGPPSATTPPATLDVSCFTSTFDDEFDAYDVSSGPVADGQHPNERWFNGTEQCCMSPSNGVPGANYPTPGPNGPVNPYSLLSGGGLQISLQDVQNEWFSGVMTSVDQNGNGFSQQYGYFEMSTQLPAGTGTWPAFWMLSLPMGAAGGEIDIFEQYGCNPPQDPSCERIFWTTLHDWADGTTPGQNENMGLPDLTAAYHRYGLLWNATYMAIYFDGALLWSATTPSVMMRPYYLLADMGIGSGFDTTQTPNPSNMDIEYIRAYSVPGF